MLTGNAVIQNQGLGQKERLAWANHPCRGNSVCSCFLARASSCTESGKHIPTDANLDAVCPLKLVSKAA